MGLIVLFYLYFHFCFAFQTNCKRFLYLTIKIKRGFATKFSGYFKELLIFFTVTFCCHILFCSIHAKKPQIERHVGTYSSKDVVSEVLHEETDSYNAHEQVRPLSYFTDFSAS